jgi:uncharacterized membrane protein YozB (DUF420 family)
MDLRADPGFLGTGASMMADLTLLAYILLIVPVMLVGFVFARRKMFVPHHRLIMTLLIAINWLLIGFLMINSYTQSVLPSLADNLTNPVYFLPTIHLITGAIAQFLGTYLVIRMWFENQLPDWFKVRRIKRYMRLTLGLWLVTAALGVLIYFTWYSSSPAVADSAADPVATPEVTPDTQAAPNPAETPEVREADEPVETPEAEAPEAGS